MGAGKKRHRARGQLRSTPTSRSVHASSRLVGTSFPCRPILLPPTRAVLLGLPIPSTAKRGEEPNRASPPIRASTVRRLRGTLNYWGRAASSPQLASLEDG